MCACCSLIHSIGVARQSTFLSLFGLSNRLFFLWAVSFVALFDWQLLSVVLAVHVYTKLYPFHARLVGPWYPVGTLAMLFQSLQLFFGVDTVGEVDSYSGLKTMLWSSRKALWCRSTLQWCKCTLSLGETQTAKVYMEISHQAVGSWVAVFGGWGFWVGSLFLSKCSFFAGRGFALRTIVSKGTTLFLFSMRCGSKSFSESEWLLVPCSWCKKCQVAGQ